MREEIIALEDLTSDMEEAWNTLEFKLYEAKCRKIDEVVSEVFQNLKTGASDYIWFDNFCERVICTRSLKMQGAIQFTSFSKRYGTPNSDEQASSLEDIRGCIRGHGIYKGVQLYIGVI